MTAQAVHSADAAPDPVALRIGVTAIGSSNWIAGVHYLHSLFYGNSLLPPEERSAMLLYLDDASHRLADFRGLGALSAGMYVTDFSPARPRGLYRELRRIARIAVHGRCWLPVATRGLARLLQKTRPDVLFAGTLVHSDIDIPQICWIPDFQHIHRPEFFSDAERQYRDRQFARIMSEANRVIVSNRCSYADAVRLYPESHHKLAVLPFTMFLGSGWQTADAGKVVRKHGLPEKFLLLPAQFWKHKNHVTVYRAMHLLHERGIGDAILVCTGLQHDYRFPDHSQELQAFLDRHALNARVRVLGLLERPEQVQLMRAAAAIVQPSLFEGWSAIVEEARSLGKTIFASDIPMHREQETKGMYFFPPDSAEALADMLARHWPDLRPGPAAKEEAAAAAYRARIREFASGFVTLCRGASMTRSRSP